jgi:hypothetical protein
MNLSALNRSVILLLGLVREGEGMAARVLRHHDVELEAPVVRWPVPTPPIRPSPSVRRANGPTIGIDKVPGLLPSGLSRATV